MKTVVAMELHSSGGGDGDLMLLMHRDGLVGDGEGDRVEAGMGMAMGMAMEMAMTSITSLGLCRQQRRMSAGRTVERLACLTKHSQSVTSDAISHRR